MVGGGCWLLLVVVGCCWLFLTRAEASQQVNVHSSLKFIVQEPSMAKNSSPSRAPKNGAQLQENPEEREKRPKRPKPPSSRLAAIKLMMKYCPDFQCEPARGSPRTPSRRKYEILPKPRRLTHDCQIQARRNNPNFKCELGLRIGVHFHVENMEIHQKSEATVVAHTRACQQLPRTPRTAPVVATTARSPPCPRTAPVEYDEICCTTAMFTTQRMN